jgi:mono/diheme cytochrome c family protein
MAALVLFASLGCRQEMYDQPKYKGLRGSDFFADGRQARPLPDGTVARGFLRTDSRIFEGRTGSQLDTEFPLPVDAALLARGRQRYEIFCSPCHDRTGYGAGMVVRRGYRAPPSFHVDRLRDAPVGHFFDVISRGFGAMPDYASQIDVHDRWAIVAYVRALQLSQNARLDALSPEERARLQGIPEAPAAPTPTPAPAPFPIPGAEGAGAPR